MAVSDETRRAYERAADEFCRAFAAPAPVLSKTSEAPVVAVNGDGTLDVGYGGAVLTVRMTTACDGVEAGDTVLLTAYGQMLYATGVLSTGNPHYAKTGKISMTPVAGDTVSQRIEFDEPFPSQPTVLTNPMTSVPGIVSTAAGNIDENGFTLYLYRTTGTQTSVMWLAYC